MSDDIFSKVLAGVKVPEDQFSKEKRTIYAVDPAGISSLQHVMENPPQWTGIDEADKMWDPHYHDVRQQHTGGGHTHGHPWLADKMCDECQGSGRIYETGEHFGTPFGSYDECLACHGRGVVRFLLDPTGPVTMGDLIEKARELLKIKGSGRGENGYAMLNWILRTYGVSHVQALKGTDWGDAYRRILDAISHDPASGPMPGLIDPPSEEQKMRDLAAHFEREIKKTPAPRFEQCDYCDGEGCIVENHLGQEKECPECEGNGIVPC